METKQITSKINWKSNGKADFATFTAGDLHGEVLVAKVADGWVAGARVLGQLGSNLKGAGYFTEGAATKRFASREEAEAAAATFATIATDAVNALRKFINDTNSSLTIKNQPVVVGPVVIK